MILLFLSYYISKHDALYGTLGISTSVNLCNPPFFTVYFYDRPFLEAHKVMTLPLLIYDQSLNKDHLIQASVPRDVNSSTASIGKSSGQ